MLRTYQAILISLFASLSISGCNGSPRGFAVTADSDSAAIVGGTAVTSDDPVSKVVVRLDLQLSETVSATCTGTIISQHQVITAAHCFKSEKGGDARLKWMVLPNGQKLYPLRVYLHPKYNTQTWTDRYDLAVVDFFSAGVPAVAALPTKSEKINLTAKFEVAGFGKLDLSVDNLLKTLMKVPTLIFAADAGLSEMMIYSGNLKGTCYGDSGGPLYERLESDDTRPIKIWGVLSRPSTPTSTKCNGADIETKTQIALDWIAEVQAGEAEAFKPDMNAQKVKKQNGI